MNIWEHLMSRCITRRHLNEQSKTSTHACTHIHWCCWNVLECTYFLHNTLIFSLVPHRVTHYWKHALNPLLKDPEISHTKTHLWCRQISTGKKPGSLSLLFVKRTAKCLNHKPWALNLDRPGSGRKWCHSHSSRSPDADKVALPGKAKRGRDR